MKTILIFFFFFLASLSITSCKVDQKTEPVQKIDTSEFLGQWTIDIQGGSVGWLEVRQEDGFLDADLLWGGGSVLPVSNVFLAKEQVLVVQRSNNVNRARVGETAPTRTRIITNWLEIEKESAEKITGWLLTPRRNSLGVDSTSIVGTKLPPVPPAPDMANLKFGNPVVLFNGKDLTGWKFLMGRI